MTCSVCIVKYCILYVDVCSVLYICTYNAGFELEFFEGCPNKYSLWVLSIIYNF